MSDENRSLATAAAVVLAIIILLFSVKISPGYRLFDPEIPWAFPHSLYWRKTLIF